MYYMAFLKIINKNNYSLHNDQDLIIIIINTSSKSHWGNILEVFTPVTHKLTHSFTSYYQMQEINNDNIFHH